MLMLTLTLTLMQIPKHLSSCSKLLVILRQGAWEARKAAGYNLGRGFITGHWRCAKLACPFIARRCLSDFMLPRDLRWLQKLSKGGGKTGIGRGNSFVLLTNKQSDHSSVVLIVDVRLWLLEIKTKSES
jgi:hypothetical protein